MSLIRMGGHDDAGTVIRSLRGTMWSHLGKPNPGDVHKTISKETVNFDP